jgi:sterol desaturase/sphingolipid hydroxylase (fatty acid hydroxylase superfamily)
MTFSDWILANDETLQIMLFFELFLVFAIAERLAPRRPGPMDRKTRWPADLALTCVNFTTLSMLPLSFLGAAYFAESLGWGLLNRVELPMALLVTITLLVRGLMSFFTHYLLHKVPLLWRLHRVHHLDTKLDVTTTVRGHPLDIIMQSLGGIPLVLAFGLTPWVLVLYELLDIVVNLWTHSNVRLPAPINRGLRYVIVTPDLHRIHHSVWQPETDSNFRAVFPIWDLIFGTFRAEPRDGHEHMRLGLEEVRGRKAHRLLWLIGSVFQRNLLTSLEWSTMADAKSREVNR